MNSGQTCVSPDYLLIHESIKNVFLKLLKKYIIEFYGEDTIKIQSMSKIINLDHFNRLKALFGKRNKIFYGGRFDEKTLSIEPTIVQVKNLSDPLMNEEIFGPILPYIVCKDFSGIIKQIRDLPKPLALYVFSKNKECINDLLTNVQSGDVCINDTIMHITNYNLPFGGVGSSGMGSYHGIFGFNSFSHTRSLVNTTTKLDPDLFYPP
jgi:aldehyde dehydrogenase (NAD+)